MWLDHGELQMYSKLYEHIGEGGESPEGPQREASGRASSRANQKFPSLKGQWVRKIHSYLKILGNTNEPTMAVLAQHTKIFTSLRVTVLKHSVKQCRTILNSISGINNETAYKLSNTICILSCIHPRYCKKTIKTTSVILIIF